MRVSEDGTELERERERDAARSLAPQTLRRKLLVAARGRDRLTPGASCMVCPWREGEREREGGEREWERERKRERQTDRESERE